MVKSIGDADYALLDSIDDPESDMTLTRAQQVVKDNAKQNDKKDNHEGTFHSNMPKEGDADNPDTEDEVETEDEDQDEEETFGDEDVDTKKEKTGSTPAPKQKTNKSKKADKPKEVCDVKLTGFSVSLGTFGDFTLDLNTGRPAILYNNAFAGHVNIVAKQANNKKEALHFVIEQLDVEWSFQVIATRLAKIVKEEEVCGNEA